MGEQEDEVRKFLESHAKKIERIVQARMSSIMDQVNTIAKDHNKMVHRLAQLEALIRSQNAASYYIASDLKFLINEIDALENYLAEKDVRLRAILDASVDDQDPEKEEAKQ